MTTILLPDDERTKQLADISATGNEDNAEISRAELERITFDHREFLLPFDGKLTRSLIGRIPTGSYVISLTCNSDGSSVFIGQAGEPSERHHLWVAIREACADQRNCHITMNGRVAEVMRRPFPTDPAERERDLELRSALLSEHEDQIDAEAPSEG